MLLVLVLAAAVGGYVLSRPGESAPAPKVQPSLFPAQFAESGFVDGHVALVTSYDAAATARRATGPITVRGTAFVVARCDRGTIRVEVGGLTSSRACTGAAAGVVAVQLARAETLVATVTTPQRGSWGVAVYQ